MLKCTSFWTLGNGGWSETWFRDGSDITAARNATTAYVNARCGISNQSVTCIGLRVSVVENPAIVSRLKLALAGTFASPRDVLNAALLLEAVSADYKRRQIWLRGIPDSMLTGGVYTPSTAFATALANYVTVIGQEGFAIRAIDRMQPLKDIVTISTTGLVTMISDPGWDAGDNLKFFRARFDNGTAIKKTYKIALKNNALEYQLAGWPAGRSALNVRARKFGLLLFRPVSFFDVAATTRKTGRPFGAPVGRRRVVRA